MLPLEITPGQVRQRIDAGEKIRLIDVREPREYEMAHIDGGELIPMRDIPAALVKLRAESMHATLVVYCHHGVRSLNVVHWLREQGVESCQSMSGGIEAWSLSIDPSVPRY
ncbi:MAG TPA: rhodanese-like domain-containing protein [Bryobacteraceae bacterium]|jgi:rhodanese-related sulfurtransferase|nr:rhodanese-like domain-containing protein [Bryobacteraceae bacterium]